MKEDEILYINHDEAELGSISAAYIEHKDKDEQPSEVVINSREEPEEAKSTETEEVVAPEAEDKAPEEPIKETTGEAPAEPLDKIDQITNSASSLPLPSEETEDIDPLLPY